jgi:hypothetical protein
VFKYSSSTFLAITLIGCAFMFGEVTVTKSVSPLPLHIGCIFHQTASDRCVSDSFYIHIVTLILKKWLKTIDFKPIHLNRNN